MDKLTVQWEEGMEVAFERRKEVHIPVSCVLAKRVEDFHLSSGSRM